MKYYVTLTGLNYRFGTQPFTVGQKVKLVKEPENDFDHEAIRAELPGLGKVGYVANSTHTVLGDCYSAGRIYDKIGAAATAKVKYVLANAVVCSVKAADMGQAGLPPVDPATGLPFGNEEDAIAFWPSHSDRKAHHTVFCVTGFSAPFCFGAHTPGKGGMYREPDRFHCVGTAVPGGVHYTGGSRCVFAAAAGPALHTAHFVRHGGRHYAGGQRVEPFAARH